MAGELRARQGRLNDADRLAALMFAAPSRESVAMSGSAEAGERFCAALFRRALADGSGYFVVAEIESTPVGFAEVSRGGDAPPFTVAARVAIGAMGIVGTARAGWKALARRKVDLSPPDGGVHLVELQVSPGHRGHGAGGFLLERVDEYAIEQRAAHISLTTASDNPARRLYERCGYRVEAEKFDARYERITGSPGRVLMLKPVSPRP